MEIKLDELKVLYSEEEIHSKIKELAKTLNNIYKGEEVVAICVLKGA